MEFDPTRPLVLTSEVIEQSTGFTLVMIFPGFADNGEISPDLHEERERFTAEYGEDNVLTSFVVEDNQLALGLFIRRPF